MSKEKISLIGEMRQKYALLNPNLEPRNVSCPCCGTKVGIPILTSGEEVKCPICCHILAKVERHPYSIPLVLALTSIIVAMIVSCSFFLGASATGMDVAFSLLETVNLLFTQDYGYLANIMVAFVFATPLIYLLSCVYVYIAIVNQKFLPYLVFFTNLMFKITPWLMVDIFFISTLVALVKIEALAEVSFGSGFIALFIYAVLLIRTVLATPKYWVYTQVMKLKSKDINKVTEDKNIINCSHCFTLQNKSHIRCIVCKASMNRQAYNNIQKTWAFLIAAIILYIPANTLPMMETYTPLSALKNNILDGVIVLWQSKDQLVAVIIFIASIFVPLVKILSILLLLFCVHMKLLASPLVLQKFYIMVDKIGRWSMVDIYVIILLMATFRSSFAKVIPGSAVIYFFLVILLTMLAVHYFDIRWLWDKSRQQKHINYE